MFVAYGRKNDFEHCQIAKLLVRDIVGEDCEAFSERDEYVDEKELDWQRACCVVYILEIECGWYG